MRSNPRSLSKNRKAASPAVSMVIITAATVVLVLVSGNYALQVLIRQQGANEYDTVKKSLLTFDDAFRDIAFDRGGSRSVRFTTQYGYMELVPEYENLSISVAEFPALNETFGEIQMGAIKYHIPTSYVNHGDGCYSYVLGNEDVSVTSATDSIGRLLESQAANLTLSLDYRVRVTKEGPSTSVGGESVNYVDILVVRMNVTKPLNLFGDFDVIARNLAVTTQYVPVGDVDSSTYLVNVTMGGKTTTIPIALDSGQLVFNLIIADIKVSN